MHQQFDIFSLLDFKFDAGILRGKCLSVCPRPEEGGSLCDLLLRIFGEMFDSYGAVETKPLLTLHSW